MTTAKLTDDCDSDFYLKPIEKQCAMVLRQAANAIECMCERQRLSDGITEVESSRLADEAARLVAKAKYLLATDGRSSGDSNE